MASKAARPVASASVFAISGGILGPSHGLGCAEKEREGYHNTEPEQLGGEQYQVGRLHAPRQGPARRGGVNVDWWHHYCAEPKEKGARGSYHDVQSAVLWQHEVANCLYGGDECEEREEDEKQ